uniref:green-sensitive opsin-like n=1 Tax=Styela clava TaxID=7725 RepID=UPI0019399249|nr:green-sensitive opsin-like [Styela clava]
MNQTTVSDFDVSSTVRYESSTFNDTNDKVVPFLPFNDVIVAVVATFLILFLILGFFGNLLTILVIVKSTKLRNIFNQFILSLCVSDLFSASVSWVNLYRRTWGFNVFVPPNFFCWFYWGADMWTSCVTSQHILGFAILRLISVWKPVRFSKIKPLHGRIWIVLIWVVGFLCGFIPFAFFSGAKIRDRSDRTSPTARWPSCTQNQETLEIYSRYIEYAYPIFFYFPLAAIALVSVGIGIVIVRKRAHMSRARTSSDPSKAVKERQKEKQAILQLGLIVGSFMLGYIPFTVYEFWTLNNKDTSLEGWKREWMFGTAQYICLRFSECLNPVFYNLASTKMRKETKKFLKGLDCRNAGSKGRAASSASSVDTGLEL